MCAIAAIDALTAVTWNFALAKAERSIFEKMANTQDQDGRYMHRRGQDRLLSVQECDSRLENDR